MNSLFALSVGGFVVLIPLAILVATCVVVWVARRRRDGAGGDAPEGRMPAESAASRRDAREAVLRQLADKELTREQAEARLAELDNPVPETLPTPPARRSGIGLGCGCLVAAVILLLLLLVMLVVGRISVPCVRRAQVKAAECRRQQIIEQVTATPHMAMPSQSGRVTPASVKPEQDGEFEL